MDELEERAETVLVSKTPVAAPAQQPSPRCAVDGCLHPSAVMCEVRLTHMELNPDRETHRLPLCDRHVKGFAALKWQWRRTPDAASSRLKLDGVFAPDAVEDA